MPPVKSSIFVTKDLNKVESSQVIPPNTSSALFAEPPASAMAPPAPKSPWPRHFRRVHLQKFYASLSDEEKAVYRANKEPRLKGSVFYTAPPPGDGTLTTVTAEVEELGTIVAQIPQALAVATSQGGGASPRKLLHSYKSSRLSPRVRGAPPCCPR